ncbi:MAG: carbon-nitrogen hydrolase family protein [Desulfurococcaceae archaeon]
MSTFDLKIIDLSNNMPGIKLGIAHITVIRDSFATNLDLMRKVAFIASEGNVKSIILPYHMPYGPVLHFMDNRSLSTVKINPYLYNVSRKHPYTRALKYVATNYDMSIISPGLIEKSGSRYYISAFFSTSELNGMITSRRKIVLSDFERKLGIMPGKTIEIFRDRYARYFVLLDEEIYVPELIRIAGLERTDIIITSSVFPHNPNNFVTLLRALAMISGVWVINSGGIFINTKADNAINIPSIIINPEGEVVGHYNDSTPALITISYKMFKTSESKSHSGRVKYIINTYINILRRHLRKLSIE